MASRQMELNLNDPTAANSWIIAFLAIARTKEWVDSDEKKQITDNFVARCGIHSLTKIIAIVQPKVITEMPFEEIKKEIETYLAPQKKLIIAERTKFYGIKQDSNENVTEFLTRLNDASKYCEFDSLKTSQSPQEEMIKMGLISGLHNKIYKSKILERMQSIEMSTKEVVEYIQQLEQVGEYTDSKSSTGTMDDNINFSNLNQKRFSQRAKKGKSAMAKCKTCGKNHMGLCRKLNIICYKCSGKGHYANECNYASDNKEETNAQEECEFADIFSLNTSAPASMRNMVVYINRERFVFKMQEDSGASCSIISSKMWEDMNRPKLNKYKGAPLVSYDGSALKIMGTIEVLVENEGVYEVHQVKVVESLKNFGLMGRDMLPCKMINSVSKEKCDQPDEELGIIRNAKAHLQIREGTKPIFCQVRQIPIPLQKDVEDELDNMVRMGIISPIKNGGSEWASPLVCSRKANGKLRLCCDFKVTINKYLLNDSYHPPDMETVFSKLENAQVFAKYDLKSAYWQIELDEESKNLTIINTTKGLFRFNRLPFGVKTASSIFQRVIENVCGGLDGIIVYQDDVLVFAKDVDELNQRSSRLLERLNKRNVSVNWEKSERCLNELSFLGHIVSRDGIKPDKKLVDKVMNISVPRTKKEVERFMGIVNFYATKIPNFASICEPINKLRRSSMPFVWNSDQEQAFKMVKKVLCSDLIVKPFSVTKELTLTCDASEKAIGAVLSQEGFPIMYLSRILTEAERNYAVIEREALAIVWAVKRAEKFLLGKHFSLKTDHKALEYLFNPNKSLPKHTSARIQRWAITMVGYDYNIEYVKGESISHVDALSRMHFSDENVMNEKIVSEGIYWSQDFGVAWKDLMIETTHDRVLKKICERVKTDIIG